MVDHRHVRARGTARSAIEKLPGDLLLKVVRTLDVADAVRVSVLCKCIRNTLRLLRRERLKPMLQPLAEKLSKAASSSAWHRMQAALEQLVQEAINLFSDPSIQEITIGRMKFITSVEGLLMVKDAGLKLPLHACLAVKYIASQHLLDHKPVTMDVSALSNTGELVFECRGPDLSQTTIAIATTTTTISPTAVAAAAAALRDSILRHRLRCMMRLLIASRPPVRLNFTSVLAMNRANLALAPLPTCGSDEEQVLEQLLHLFGAGQEQQQPPQQPLQQPPQQPQQQPQQCPTTPSPCRRITTTLPDDVRYYARAHSSASEAHPLAHAQMGALSRLIRALRECMGLGLDLDLDLDVHSGDTRVECDSVRFTIDQVQREGEGAALHHHPVAHTTLSTAWRILASPNEERKRKRKHIILTISVAAGTARAEMTNVPRGPAHGLLATVWGSDAKQCMEPLLDLCYITAAVAAVSTAKEMLRKPEPALCV